MQSFRPSLDEWIDLRLCEPYRYLGALLSTQGLFKTGILRLKIDFFKRKLRADPCEGNHLLASKMNQRIDNGMRPLYRLSQPKHRN